MNTAEDPKILHFPLSSFLKDITKTIIPEKNIMCYFLQFFLQLNPFHSFPCDGSHETEQK